MLPLPERVRPKTLNEFIGQKHLIGENKPISTMVLTNTLESMIFYGPPATGKTTLANILASHFGYGFIKTNALTLNLKLLNEILFSEKKSNTLIDSEKKVLFIDEFHRLNKPKQDLILSPIEKGEIILIGATTENPFFVLQKALRSRVFIYEFSELSQDEKNKIVINALENDNLFKNFRYKIDKETIFYLTKNDDVRKGLKILEFVILSKIYSILKNSGFHISSKNIENFLFYLSTDNDKESYINFESKQFKSKTEIKDFFKSNLIEISVKDIDQFLQKKETKYSKSDDHYNTISAYIKSIRGSDPDAAIYYLALMLESGEDPLFIARRLVILAAEDIGLAYPDALTITVSALNAIERIGMPEARIILAEITILLATLPKSNSAYLAIEKAIGLIKNGKILKIPQYLKGGGYKLYNNLANVYNKEKNKMNYNKDNLEIEYKYPHNFKNHWVKQKYLTEDLKIFEFSDMGFEKKLKNWIEKIKK